MKKQPTPSPGPPVSIPPADPVQDVLSGNTARGEPAGCPTGLADTLGPQPASEPLQGAKPGTIYSPGEGVNEEQQKRSGLDE